MARSEELYVTVSLKLPVFAVAVLRERAKKGRERLSSAVERAILESLMLDEVGAAAKRSPRLGRAFAEWFRVTVSAQRAKGSR